MEFIYNISYEQWIEYQTFLFIEKCLTTKDVFIGQIKMYLFSLFCITISFLLVKSFYIMILSVLILLPMCLYYSINWKKYLIKRYQKTLIKKYPKEQLISDGTIGKRKLTLLNDKVEYLSDKSNDISGYSSFTGFIELRNICLLRQSSINGIIIPNEIFVSEDIKNQFITFIKDKGVISIS